MHYRQWKMKAETEKDFKEWVYNIGRAYRPCWVEESATQCWVIYNKNNRYVRRNSQLFQDSIIVDTVVL